MSTPSTEVAVRSDEALALMRQQEEEEAAQPTSYRTPILKLCQALTAEVKAGDAEAGDFFNTLTDESYGNSVEFIVADRQLGRSASSGDGRYFVAIEQENIPDSWADLVGEEFVGTPFAEYPDAEEEYKHRVNAKEIPWGKGPKISTTYNYTGLVLPPAIEGDDEEPQPMPVRISFLRSTKDADDKLRMLKNSTMRNKGWWERVFRFTSKEKTFGRNTSYVVEVKSVRDSTPDEQQFAVELGLANRAGRVQANEEAGQDKPVAPATAGGLGV